MKYLDSKPFVITGEGSKKAITLYRDNYDKVFTPGKKRK